MHNYPHDKEESNFSKITFTAPTNMHGKVLPRQLVSGSICIHVSKMSGSIGWRVSELCRSCCGSDRKMTCDLGNKELKWSWKWGNCYHSGTGNETTTVLPSFNSWKMSLTMWIIFILPLPVSISFREIMQCCVTLSMHFLRLTPCDVFFETKISEGCFATLRQLTEKRIFSQLKT